MTTTTPADKARAKRQFVYDHIDAHWPELWNQPEPVRMSPALLDRIARDLVAEHPAKKTRPLWSQHKFAREQVAKWVAHPSRWSPHVDRVAVDRALHFDWGAIANLTDEERVTFHRALAAHPDPWGEDPHLSDTILVEARAKGWAQNFSDTLKRPSPRKLRFQGGPRAAREAVYAAVARFRAKARGAA